MSIEGKIQPFPRGLSPENSLKNGGSMAAGLRPLYSANPLLPLLLTILDSQVPLQASPISANLSLVALWEVPNPEVTFPYQQT